MKQCISLPLLLSFFLVFNGSVHCQDTLPARSVYSAVHYRLGVSSFRDLGIGFSPFGRRNPSIIAGVGYRHDWNVAKNWDCSLNEAETIGTYLHGPYLMFGYDTKNVLSASRASYSFQLNVRYLRGDDVKFTHEGCANVPLNSPYYIYGLNATDLVGKIYVDFGDKEKVVDFYLGFGLGLRFLTKAYSIKGTIERYGRSDEIEHEVIGIPVFDAGFRFNLLADLYR